MQEFLIRLIIVVLVVWLMEKIISVFQIKEPAARIVMIATLIIGVLWLLFVYKFLPVP